MRKIRIVFILMAMLSTQQAFADDVQGMPMDSSRDKPCATIAKACLASGFARSEAPGKRFWQDCMKPVILGQAVIGVTVDSAEVQACRVGKIEELKKELIDLEAVKPQAS